MPKTLEIAGVSLEIEERGDGRALLFLHDGEGLAPERPWFDLLARQNRVIAPSHPGWGRSVLPNWMMGVDDLAYLYLDLADRFDLRDSVLVGAGFGGWIAAEMAVRDTARFSRLVLVDALGIKNGGVADRDIADMHAIGRGRYFELAWADPAKGAVDYEALPDDDLAAIVRGQQAFAHFGWKPYMHNPRLKRWLHRVRLPTLLLWGEQDRIVAPAYAEGFLREIPNSTLRVIPDAGHFPHWEQPDAFARHLSAFAN